MFSGFMASTWAVATIVAVVAGVVGFFIVLRGSAFVADAVPQGAFAGAAGASLLGINTLIGLAVASLAGALGIGWLGRHGRRDCFDPARRRAARYRNGERLSDNSERLYESDNGVLGRPHRSAASGRSGASETEMTQLRIDSLSLMYKKSPDPGNFPTASRRSARTSSAGANGE